VPSSEGYDVAAVSEVILDHMQQVRIALKPGLQIRDPELRGNPKKENYCGIIEGICRAPAWY
jgi:hypothetical protein